MEHNNNAVATVAEQNKVTRQLLMDYLKQTNSNLLQNEQAQFLAIAQTFNLNPWKREVYAVAYCEGSRRKLSIIVGYEVYLRRAEEFPQYDGYETTFAGAGADMCCTCKVFRKDRNHATGATVFLREYTQGNTMWNTKPRVMLEKVAIATAMRRAFPSEFNGMPYIADELPDSMTGADRLNAQGYTEVPQQPAEPKQEATKGAAKTQEEKDANWLAMCDELRERNTEAFDNYLKQHNIPDLAEIRGSKERQALYTEVKAVIDLAGKEADNG